MIRAFGTGAQCYADRLPDVEAVLATPDGIAGAYFEAVRRRESGKPFYTMMLADDPRTAFGYKTSEAIFAQFADYDLQRLLMDQFTLGAIPINNVRADIAWRMDEFVQGVIVEFLSLGDAMLVRSFSEHLRFNDWFARAKPRRPLRPFERILAASRVPAVERVCPDRPAVVVWAPEYPAVEMALNMHGLAEFNGEITCVSAGGPPPARSQARFIGPEDPELGAILARACTIVCGDLSDPSDAIAFAQRGYGVVAPLTSGAHEFAAGIVPWDALDPRFLFTAAAAATARPATVRSLPPDPPRAPAPPPRPAYTTDLPLVSILTPTYNRRDHLRSMLNCLAAQTYPRIESVVVNDGGESIADIVAEFPFARLIDLPENVGALMAVEIGRKQVRGEYIGLLPDDDWLYPDHVERLMNAMFQSGADVAHGAALLRYTAPDASGNLNTWAFNARTFSETVSPTAALVSAPLGGHQMLLRTAIYDEVGGYLTDSEVSDNEMHIRLTQRYFYAFTDQITAEFRDHSAGAGRQCDFPAALRRIYEKVHPLHDRPLVQGMRAATIANIERRPAGEPPFPPSIRVAAQPEPG